MPARQTPYRWTISPMKLNRHCHIYESCYDIHTIMFLTGHITLAYILYKLLGLNASLWLFLLFSIVPDAIWPFFKNHRKESWYHTPLVFAWTLFFYPYWIAVLSHFAADAIFYVIRLTPWSKSYIGFGKNKKSIRIDTSVPLPERLIRHLIANTKWYDVAVEIVLLAIALFLFLK